jgi:glycosyltransferase involved in cell wall biosynthesis
MILPRGYSKQNYYGFSTKLGEYLETNIPILTTLVGDTGIYFVDRKNCFTYDQENTDSLETKLFYIVNNYNEIVPDIINGGNTLINDVFHYSNYSNKIVKFFND